MPVTGPAGEGSGFTVTASEEGIPSPQLLLCPLTVKLPDAELIESKVTVIELVPDPAVIVVPVGVVHIYESAPMIAGTE